jgi:hypothetical protein
MVERTTGDSKKVVNRKSSDKSGALKRADDDDDVSIWVKCGRLKQFGFKLDLEFAQL